MVIKMKSISRRSNLIKWTTVLGMLLCLVFSNFNYLRAATLTKSYKSAAENNPIVTQRYSADPSVMVYGDTVYLYSTNDEFEYKNGSVSENTYGNIKTLNCFSSKDLVNWTDHGVIQVAGSSGAATWATCSWAPSATYKKINGVDKFFLYFANSGGGIGVLQSDSPTGPWTDPIGRPLITKSTANCSDVPWLFDPAVLVDDDGSGYLYFGGGIPGSNFSNPKTARVVKLGNDMVSLAGTPVAIDAPYLFEDSGINKIGNKYYYSYCSNWNTSGSGYNSAAIEYMVSNSPMGPFTYVGEIFKNPGVYFGVWGNNHHSIFEFQGNYYMAYHARALETAQLGKNYGYRSTQIDQLTIRNGVFSSLTPTMAGTSQLSYIDPYETVQAETIAIQAGISIKGAGDTTVTDIDSGDWIGLKGVNFKNGLSQIEFSVSSYSNGSIQVYVDSPEGTLLGTVSVSNTGGVFRKTSALLSNITGVNNLFFVFTGNMSIDKWKATAKSGGTTSGETLSDGWYYIKNINAQKYLQVANNQGGNSVNVEIGSGTGVKGQKWYLKNLNGGYITLQNGQGYMLDVQYGENKDGTNIQTYSSNSADAQKFKLVAGSGENTYGILTKVSSDTKALDVYNFGTADGSNVCQWAYYANSCQLWVFEACSN